MTSFYFHRGKSYLPNLHQHTLFFSGRLFPVVVLWLGLSLSANAQVENTTASKRDVKILLQHYTTAQLDTIQQNDPVKYAALVYYYTKSFILEPIPCSDCITVDPSLFDITRFERFRKKSTRYVREYDKYGFRLTLLSVDEMLYKLPIHLENNN